jgi:hypothetical protein
MQTSSQKKLRSKYKGLEAGGGPVIWTCNQNDLACIQFDEWGRSGLPRVLCGFG